MIDYNILGGLPQRPKSNVYGAVTEGYNQGRMNRLGQTVRDEFASGKPNMNNMLSGLGEIDPKAAMSMLSNSTKGSGRGSVYQMKLDAMGTDKAKALLTEYKKTADEAVIALQKDPKANIVPFLNTMGQIEAEYKSETGVPMATTITGAMIKNAVGERSILEKNEDDAYSAISTTAKQVTDNVDAQLSEFGKGSSELRRALALLNSQIPDGSNLDDVIQITNPAAINSAVKIYVKALDNSAVMQGEIGAITGPSLMEKVRGWVNGVFTGNKMTGKEIQDIYNNLNTLAKAHDSVIDKIGTASKEDVKARLSLDESTGRIEDLTKYESTINDIVTPKLRTYKIGSVRDTPNFGDVDFFTQENKPTIKSGGGGVPKPNPFANRKF